MALPEVLLPDSEVQHILKSKYGLEGKISILPGDADLNYRIEQNGRPTYVLKISRDDKIRDDITFQVSLLNHLRSKHLKLQLPEFVPSWNSKPFEEYTAEDGSLKLIRLLKWVDGRLWSSVNPITDALRESLGRAGGMITTNLTDFDHPFAYRHLEWDIANALWTKDHLDLFKGEEREAAVYFQTRFETDHSRYQRLRKTVAHNDINDNNILVSPDLRQTNVSGIIDFGDAVKTQLINDLAIVCTYGIMNTNDPLEAARPIVSAYHKSCPLKEEELEFLYDCIGMRLVISLTKSAINATQEPANTYHQVSRRSGLELLAKWRSVSSDFAHFTFRSSCGFESHPQTARFNKWAETRQFSLNDLFPTVDRKMIYPVDMSVSSTWLGHETEYQDLDWFQFKIEQLQKIVPDRIIAGGYLEPRSVYSADSYEKLGNYGKTSRTVHLGIDYWLPAYTQVHAFLEGEVVCATNDEGDKEYGGLVILKHNPDGLLFYSLYGHLTVESATSHHVGDQLKKGDQIGELGPFPENGNWVPHLHFQVMHSMLDYNNDFAGVCFPDQVEVWRDLCPNPNLLFKSDGLDVQSALSFKDKMNFRKKHLGKSLSLSYDEPIQIVRGSGAYLIDLNGRKFLDTVNNVAHVGHEHKDVVLAGQQQMGVLNTNTRYLHENINMLSTELLKTLPSELEVLHFVNSGSEANELALRMLTTITGSQNVIASQWGYHGNTNACINVSSYKFDRKGGMGKPKNTHIFPMPDSFRGLYRGENTASQYLEEVRRVLELPSIKEEGIAGLIMESILSCGGQVELPRGFLPGLYRLVRELGGLCIADEVQTGCGRVGKSYWAFELHDVIPEIVTIGKPLGNGHPVAAVACTREVADKFANGMEFFNTFGGNPVSCAVATEVLRVVKRERLQENALQTGEYLKSKLKVLAAKYPIMGDIRGQGLFLGIELVDRNMNPLPEEAGYLINRMKVFGILMSSDGPDNNVIKIKPPMVFNKNHADDVLYYLEKILGEDFMKRNF